MKLETQIEEHCKSNEDNFSDAKEERNDIKKDIHEIKVTIQDWLEKADKRYASKRTEQLFYTVLGGAVVYIVYKLIDLL